MITDPVLLAKLTEWHNAISAFNEAKNTENRLRQEIAAMAFVAPVEGTQYSRLPAGYRVRLVHKINRTLDVALLPLAIDRLRKEAQINPDQLIEYKPTLKDANFRDAAPLVKEILANVVTEKPGMPTLSIEPPEKNWKDETGAEFFRWFRNNSDGTFVWATKSMIPPASYTEVDESQVPPVDRSKRT